MSKLTFSENLELHYAKRGVKHHVSAINEHKKLLAKERRIVKKLEAKMEGETA